MGGIEEKVKNKISKMGEQAASKIFKMYDNIDERMLEISDGERSLLDLFEFLIGTTAIIVATTQVNNYTNHKNNYSIPKYEPVSIEETVIQGNSAYEIKNEEGENLAIFIQQDNGTYITLDDFAETVEARADSLRELVK